MPAGTTTAFPGGSVPKVGETTLTQINAGTDWLTFTQLNAATGDVFVVKDNLGNERYVVEADGTLQKFKVNVVSKTADYTVTAADSGTFFNTLGAVNAVDFTLPTAADGLFYRFTCAAVLNAATMSVTATPANSLVAFNNIACSTISVATANKTAGVTLDFWSDGTAWYLGMMNPFDGAVTNGATISISA